MASTQGTDWVVFLQLHNDFSLKTFRGSTPKKNCLCTDVAEFRRAYVKFILISFFWDRKCFVTFSFIFHKIQTNKSHWSFMLKKQREFWNCWNIPNNLMIADFYFWFHFLMICVFLSKFSCFKWNIKKKCSWKLKIGH